MLAGYIRVSHVGGRKVLRSPDDQAAEIARWAAARGHDVTMLAPELDAKGSDASRPIFREAVEGVKAGRFGGVVVAYLSRAGRDLRLMLDLWDEVEGVGGVVYSARENIDGSTSAGRLHRNLLASINQHELEERREGFEHARRSAVERGIWQRRQTPRGYTRDPNTRRLVPDERAGEVGVAARDLLAGATVLSLAERLSMTTGGVRAMLRNRVYLGELRVGKHVNPDAHPPLLGRETFEAVQARLDNGTRPARSGPPALLAGLVRCGSCGHVMTRSGSKGARAYTCPAQHSGERCPGPASIACARLDGYVEPIARAELRKLQATLTAGGRVEALHQRVAQAKAELSAYLSAVDAAGLGAADAADGMRQRREVVDRAEAEQRAEIAKAPMIPHLSGGEAAWDRLSHQHRNDLLRGLLSCVVVWPAGRGKTMPVSQRARVLRYGAAVTLPGRGAGTAVGIVPIHNIDGNDVLGVISGEDAL